MGMNLSKGATNPTRCFSDLPDPIIAEIISRLPIQSLLQCMCVCKTWFQLISSSHFNNFLLKKRSHITFILETYSNQYHLCEIEHKSNRKKSLVPIKPIMLKTRFGRGLSMLSLIGICNGLICSLAAANVCYVILIWNPILGQYKTVQIEAERCEIVGFGFGYCQVADQFKVLIIVQRERGVFEVDVLTIGPNTWRRAGKTHGDPLKRYGFCCYKGTIHWICGCGDDSHSEWICCFDISTEKQRSICPPPDCTNKNPIVLKVVGDCLCIVVGIDNGILLWSLKDYGGVEQCWTKHVFIDLSCSFIPRVQLVSTLWEDKEILILEYLRCLAYYDYEEKQYVKVKTTIDDKRRSQKINAYAYFPSFVPLSKVFKEEASKMVMAPRDESCCFGLYWRIYI